MSEPLDPLVAYSDDPFGDTVHHPYSAYNQGHEAALRNYLIEDNPYPLHTETWYWWLEGYSDCIDDLEADRGVSDEEWEDMEDDEYEELEDDQSWKPNAQES